MDDNSRMPYGKHKGETMGSIPPQDLLWLYENNRCNQEVKQYIEDNLETIKLQIKQNQKR
jgi:uncharacterized protein (DUF3820 family)